MATNVRSLGDTELRVTGVNLASPLVTHFFNVFSQVPQARVNPLKTMGVRMEATDGSSLSVPIKQGQLSVRRQVIGEDRTLQGVGLNAPRTDIKWVPFALEVSVEEGESSQNQLRFLEDQFDDVVAAMNRNEVQVCIDALNKIKTGSLGEQGNALGAVDVRTKRSTTAVYGAGTRVKTGAAVNLNYQKLAAARTLANRGNLGGRDKPVCLISHAAADGLSADDQQISADFVAGFTGNDAWDWMPNFKGFRWAIIGDYPNQHNGDAGGLPRATKTVNGDSVCVERGYVFDPKELFVVYPSDKQMHQIEFWRDVYQKKMWLTYTGYMECAYVRPESLVLLLNALPSDAVTSTGGL